MVDRTEVQDHAQQLRGKRTGFTYDDLARILRQCGCEQVSGRGSHRTWRHPAVRQLLTLVDAGSGEVLSVYISRTRKYLLLIADVIND